MKCPSHKIVLNLVFMAIALLLLAPPVVAQQTMQTLHKHVRTEITNGQVAPVGVLPSTQHLKLNLLLPLSDPAGLNNFLQDLYDPTSPSYHQFLSVAEFTNRFAPTPEHYQAVVDFAKANGFTVYDAPPNRMLVPVDATVAQVEKAFNVKMTVYPHPTENRTFYSPDREPSLALSAPVSHIEGLSTFSLPHSTDLRYATTTSGVKTFTSGAGPGGAYLGSDFRAAYYGGSALTGAGQSIGLFGVAFDIGDVTAYFQAVGQSFNPSVVQTVASPGVSTSCPTPCDDAEQMVDIMRSYSMAPGVSAIYEFIGNGNTGTFNLMATHNPLPLNLSSSISYVSEDPSSEEPIFQEFAAQGQSFFQASGDSGAYKPSDANGSSYYPAESSWATPAGGTDLTTSGPGGSWVSETAWNGSGGGPSPDGFAIPSWQVGLANGSNGASSTLRNLPDVASEANTDNYFCNKGGQCGNGIGGTSLSAPLWAGFMALVNQQAAQNGAKPVGLLGPTVAAIGKSSSYNSNFHDITSGNNNNGTASYNAVTGYDLVTGWGTPTAALINTLAGGGTTCSASPITPYLQLNGGAWQQTANATVTAGASVNLGPQPVTGGSWSWTGPNGYSSSSRQIALTINFTSTYTATYTNSCGAKSTQSFTLTLTGCAPSTITPYIQVNGGAWQQVASATVSAGASVNLGPQPATGGSWSWTGPNGYSSTSRQIGVTVNTTSTYTATYTNPSGCKSTQSFTLTVTGSPTPTPTPTPVNCTPSTITPYVQVNGGSWQQTANTTVSAGASVNLGPQPVTGGSWSWTGPNGYSSTSRQIAVTINTTSTYTATYTNSTGCKSTQSFTLTVTGSPTPTPTPGGGGTCATAWAAGVAYSVGQEVSYAGNNYTCLQAHTSQVGWEPPNVASLWKLVGTCH